MTTDIMTVPIAGMVGVTHGSGSGIEPIMVSDTALIGMIATGMASPIALTATEITTESRIGAIGVPIILIAESSYPSWSLARTDLARLILCKNTSLGI